MKNGIKDKLLKKLDNLSEEDLKEIFDFTNYLLSRKDKEFSSEAVKSVPSNKENDPLQEYIGGVSDGNLSKKIDQDLYGG